MGEYTFRPVFVFANIGEYKKKLLTNIREYREYYIRHFFYYYFYTE